MNRIIKRHDLITPFVPACMCSERDAAKTKTPRARTQLQRWNYIARSIVDGTLHKYAPRVANGPTAAQLPLRRLSDAVKIESNARNKDGSYVNESPRITRNWLKRPNFRFEKTDWQAVLTKRSTPRASNKLSNFDISRRSYDMMIIFSECASPSSDNFPLPVSPEARTQFEWHYRSRVSNGSWKIYEYVTGVRARCHENVNWNDELRADSSRS